MSTPEPVLPTFRVVALTARPLPASASASDADGFGPFVWNATDSADEARAWLAAGEAEALLIDAESSAEVEALAVEAAHDVALLVVADQLDAPTVLRWLQRGAQELVTADELQGPGWPARLRAAIERKRLEREARTVYATDLETGLPHQQQFIEHVSQLLALRAREPAPMAVLALRIEGLATTEARLGRDAANALRRKVGVRLRAGVRASDVVASLGDDGFAVLLGSILAPSDAVRVGEKLMQALQRPFKVAAQDTTIAAALGIAHYPADGAQPDALLRRATGLAASMQAQGRAGFSNFAELSAPLPGAANDD